MAVTFHILFTFARGASSFHMLNGEAFANRLEMSMAFEVVFLQPIS